MKFMIIFILLYDHCSSEFILTTMVRRFDVRVISHQDLLHISIIIKKLFILYGVIIMNLFIIVLIISLVAFLGTHKEFQ